jgi:hypothetical protein
MCAYNEQNTYAHGHRAFQTIPTDHATLEDAIRSCRRPLEDLGWGEPEEKIRIIVYKGRHVVAGSGMVEIDRHVSILGDVASASDGRSRSSSKGGAVSSDRIEASRSSNKADARDSDGNDSSASSDTSDSSSISAKSAPGHSHEGALLQSLQRTQRTQDIMGASAGCVLEGTLVLLEGGGGTVTNLCVDGVDEGPAVWAMGGRWVFENCR